ncbi:substrate-binding domain-containing protein [Streptomyces sparsogenes]|uniref:substrate-binding domain-containing protein n=1 Tax=Streptomyces sparsogenes TaxID=67365 RepID=UPI003322B156
MLHGEPAPTGPARRGAKPGPFDLATIDDQGLPPVLAELAAARADEMDADTVNRELSIARKAISWWQRQGWSVGDPTIGIERRPAPPDRTKALSKPQITALWALEASVREKTFWKLLYERATRADEILCLNIEELFPADKRGRVVSKGGAVGWIHWQSGTAQLLPRPIAGRTHGPLFLTDRRAPRPHPGHLPGDRTRPAVLPQGGRDLRGDHPAAGQPPSRLRRLRRPGGLDSPPASAQCAHPRRGGRHLLGGPGRPARLADQPQRLLARGVQVPDDVAIAGYDAIKTVLDVYPPLTTVHVPHQELGRAAVRLALRHEEFPREGAAGLRRTCRRPGLHPGLRPMTRPACARCAKSCIDSQ